MIVRAHDVDEKSAARDDLNDDRTVRYIRTSSAVPWQLSYRARVHDRVREPRRLAYALSHSILALPV